MPDLLLPDTSPPLLGTETREKLTDMIFMYGLPAVYEEAFQGFIKQHRLLAHYIRRFEFEQNGNTLVDSRPQRVFRIGAMLTGMAYLESGYDVSADPTFAVAQEEAELEGIPKAFVLSYVPDIELQALMEVVSEVPQMQDGVEQGSYDQLLAIGAGCTRHYLQHAIAA